MASLHEAGEKASDEAPSLPATETTVKSNPEDVAEIAELRIEE